MKGIRLYLVNRQRIVREALATLFSEQPRVTVVGQCDDGLTCLRDLGNHHSDIVMTDLDLPDMTGYTLCRRVIALHPATRVVVLSEHREAECAARAVQAGAAGYLHTDEAPARMMKMIDRICRGRFEVSAALTAGLLECLESNEPAQRLEKLTTREFELLCLLARGLTPKRCGELMNVSSSSISTFRSRMLRKLGLTSTGELIRFAVEQGLGGSCLTCRHGRCDYTRRELAQGYASGK